MKKKYFILFICTIILIIISASVMVFSNTNKNFSKDKVQEELSYLDTKLLGMLNSLNNIPFSNSILLEQNSIKGQSGSNNQNSISGNSQSSSSDSSSGGSDSSSDSSSGSTSSSSGGSFGDSPSKDYSKYSVESQNILINSENKIDWNYLKNTIEIVYTAWPTIMIDLHSANIKNEDILNFSNNLDTLILSTEKEDKRATLNSLGILYSLIPIYTNQFLDDGDEINLAYTKSHIINSYVLLEDDRWDDMKVQIDKAQEYFGIIMNSVKEDREQSSINKTYVLLNEMKNAINLKDKKLYYLKYKKFDGECYEYIKWLFNINIIFQGRGKKYKNLAILYFLPRP